MSKDHELKCLPPYFEALVSGAKVHETRKDDRGFALGDHLILNEWRGGYTGRYVRREITYIAGPSEHTPLPQGWVVLSLAPVAPTPAPEGIQVNDERCPQCGEPRPGRGTKEYGFHVCPAPEAPRETRCPNPHCEDGLIRGTVVGCGICQSSPRPRRKDGAPIPPVAELSLDFWGACESAGLRRLCYRIPETMRDALNQQLREKVADAVAKERARGQELRRLVREWQEAWKVRASDPMELESECRWLAAFDLGPEGDQ